MAVNYPEHQNTSSSDPLAPLLADGVIDQVFTRLKSGKEADIYLVQHASEVVAAKVYRDRQMRSFRNNAVYQEGRQVRSSRTKRAMSKGSRFGKEASETAWKTKESEALHTLHAAGVRVPQPVLFYEGVLLMEVVVDGQGRPAPRLIDAAIPKEQAALHYADLRQQMVRMLMCDLIHGDLSPYNVLMAWNGPTIIDFPQVVGAAHNSQAEFFFQRDLQALRRFYAAIDPSLNGAGNDGREIWRAYTRRELTPDFVPTGKVEPHGQPHQHQPHRGDRHQRKGSRPQRGGDQPRRVEPSGAPGRRGAGAPRTSQREVHVERVGHLGGTEPRHAAKPSDRGRGIPGAPGGGQAVGYGNPGAARRGRRRRRR